jgi:glycosyltransferase involved in cell wall biosynthesis
MSYIADPTADTPLAAVSQPLTFSIVTPSFNQAHFLGEALSSVRDQRYHAVEHLVIDGASTDGTIDILRRHSNQPGWKHLRWVSEPDRGQSEALNKGFACAKGDIVGWLNSDDRYLPGCFEAVSHAFSQHPDVDVVYGDYRWINEEGLPYRLRREIEFNPFVLLYHRVLYIPSTATFFRRRIFDDNNYLDEKLHYALDFELFVRLAMAGYRFKHIPAVLADFRFQRNSKTCLASHKQLEETRQITEFYSPVLNTLRSPSGRRVVLLALRSLAACLRYSEKLMRGYYFQQRVHESRTS